MNVTAVHGIHLYTRGKFKLLSQLSLEERKEKLATYTKFFFVREPYERLLSAYRDCFYGSYRKLFKRLEFETKAKEGKRRSVNSSHIQIIGVKMAGNSKSIGEHKTSSAILAISNTILQDIMEHSSKIRSTFTAESSSTTEFSYQGGTHQARDLYF